MARTGLLASWGKRATTGESPSYRWLILLVAWLALVMSFADRLAWASLAAEVGASLGLQVASLGAFVSAFYVGYVGANVLGGMATDRLGPSRMAVVAMVPLSIGTFFFGFTTSLTAGLVLQLLMGIAAGADYSACVKLTATWFDFHLRGRAMGLLITASSLAVVLTNLLVPTLSKLIGWRGVYQTFGGITLVVALLCWLVLRDAPAAETPATGKPRASQLFRNRDLVLLSLTGFCALWGTWGFAFWVNALMIKGHGIDPVRAGFIAALYGLGAVIAKPAIGWLSDLLGGRRKLLVVLCLASFTAMLLVFGELKTETAFLIAAPLLGVTAFVYAPLMAAMIAEIAGPALVGSATGFSNALWQLGNVIVPLAVGFVYQSTNSFEAAFATLAAGPFLGTILMLAVREKRLF